MKVAIDFSCASIYVRIKHTTSRSVDKTREQNVWVGQLSWCLGEHRDESSEGQIVEDAFLIRASRCAVNSKQLRDRERRLQSSEMVQRGTLNPFCTLPEPSLNLL
jgi:hypothetical protein